MKSPIASLREWVSRLPTTFSKKRSDADLQAELESHLDFAIDEARRRGASPRAAVRAARIQTGTPPQAIEALRDQRGLPWLEDVARDLRYGCRSLAGAPGFTIVSVLSLAVGIGVNGAVFSFADALLLRPLAVPRSHELLTIGSTDRAVDGPLRASYREYVDLRDRKQDLRDIGAVRGSLRGLRQHARGAGKGQRRPAREQ